MSHNDSTGAPASGETFADLLRGFFPSSGEMSAFVVGTVLGMGILAVLLGLAFLIGGHQGLWPTF